MSEKTRPSIQLNGMGMLTQQECVQHDLAENYRNVVIYQSTVLTASQSAVFFSL